MLKNRQHTTTSTHKFVKSIKSKKVKTCEQNLTHLTARASTSSCFFFFARKICRFCATLKLPLSSTIEFSMSTRRKFTRYVYVHRYLGESVSLAHYYLRYGCILTHGGGKPPLGRSSTPCFFLSLSLF